MTQYSSVTDDRRIALVFEYVLENLTFHPSLAEVASVAGLERTYFCKYFQAAVGVRFSVWNRNLRIECAKQLLRERRLTISAVADAVGYSDVTTFERNFRKCSEYSPRDYRRLVRNANSTISAEKFTTVAETRWERPK